MTSERRGAARTTVGLADRERLAGHPALCVWLTGLSGAGKTTLSHATERRLHAAGVRHVWSTDCVPHASNVVGVAPLLAAALQQAA